MKKQKILKQKVMQISVEDYVVDLKRLVNSLSWIKDEIDVVIGISRGGLIPATVIACKFSKPLVTIESSYYTGRKRLREVKLTFPLNMEKVKGRNILVVDELIDTGQTIKRVEEELVSFRPKTTYWRTMYSKKETKNSIVNLNTDDWVSFFYDPDFKE